MSQSHRGSGHDSCVPMSPRPAVVSSCTSPFPPGLSGCISKRPATLASAFGIGRGADFFRACRALPAYGLQFRRSRGRIRDSTPNRIRRQRRYRRFVPALRLSGRAFGIRPRQVSDRFRPNRPESCDRRNRKRSRVWETGDMSCSVRCWSPSTCERRNSGWNGACRSRTNRQRPF